MKARIDSLKQKDAGRALAALSDKVMEELGVDRGDHVEISSQSGAGSALARVWPGYPQDSGEKVVRVDGDVRRRANVNIDEKAEVTTVTVKEAKSITVALPEHVANPNQFRRYLTEKLNSLPIKQGQTKRFRGGLSGGNRLTVDIVSTDPSDGYVVVTDRTDIRISDDSSESQEDDTSLDVVYEDIGGLDEELDKVREMIEIPMRHPELFNRLGVDPPKGVLLHGPPGTGKTMMAKAVANEIDANFETVSGPEIMSKYYGESEEKLREVFDSAEENAPSIIFFDELDAIAPQREEASGDVERRVVAQLLSLMDGLEDRGDVIVIGATNRANALDPALRRGGRFDREIEIGVPDKEGRKEILQVHTRDMPLGDDFDLEQYSENTHGFVGADLAALSKEAAMTAIRRIRPKLDLESQEIDQEMLDSIQVVEQDFRTALKDIEPSALREVFVEVPDITWDDVGGLEQTKDRLKEAVQWPLDHPNMFKKLDMNAPKGVLLYGPPGTGKTLLAKAIANESQSNFISIKGPELLNKYVGESEKGVREVFSKARENAPTVVFFDEIDSIAGERGQSMGDSGVGERVVSQLLTELDGLEELEDVVVIATSNRPDLIDNALIRPGRLDRHIHVPVPQRAARKKVFEVHTKNKPIDDSVDLDVLAEKTDGYVGADIEAVCREASLIAGRELMENTTSEADFEKGLDTVKVTMEHFEQALTEIGPSVDEGVRDEYDEIEEGFQKSSPAKERDGSRGPAFQ